MKKEKTCKVCKKKFTPERDFQVVCDYQCGIAYAKVLQEKREAKKKAEKRVALREFKSEHKPTLLQLAQTLVNKFIRLRDKDELCISCGHDFKNGRQAHAGHYIPRSRSSFLRFDEDNIHKQCSICNNYLSGNVGAYRVNLIIKIGIDRVIYLEKHQNSLKKYTIQDLKDIIKKYRIKIKSIS